MRTKADRVKFVLAVFRFDAYSTEGLADGAVWPFHSFTAQLENHMCFIPDNGVLSAGTAKILCRDVCNWASLRQLLCKASQSPRHIGHKCMLWLSGGLSGSNVTRDRIRDGN